MALLTYVRDIESGSPLFAVIADDDGADYLWPEEGDPWFDETRLENLTKFIEKPTTAVDWMSVATTNLGQVKVDDPIEIDDIDDAVNKAEETLADYLPDDGKDDLLARSAIAFDDVARDYPGFMEDDESTTPEAMENFVMMALGPIDPDGPNGWILRAQDGNPEPGDEDKFVSFAGEQTEATE